MKLKDCKFGQVVINDRMEIGHIVGFTYNCSIKYTGSMTDKEKYERTIPLVKFPDGERGFHHENLSIFKG